MFEEDLILNMDETPMYFDQLEDRTVEEKGADTVEIMHTENEKTRFTLCITVTASGIMLPAYIIWKGESIRFNFKLNFNKIYIYLNIHSRNKAYSSHFQNKANSRPPFYKRLGFWYDGCGLDARLPEPCGKTLFS